MRPRGHRARVSLSFHTLQELSVCNYEGFVSLNVPYTEAPGDSYTFFC